MVFCMLSSYLQALIYTDANNVKGCGEQRSAIVSPQFAKELFKSMYFHRIAVYVDLPEANQESASSPLVSRVGK